jgi:hypothetical protein
MTFVLEKNLFLFKALELSLGGFSTNRRTEVSLDPEKYKVFFSLINEIQPLMFFGKQIYTVVFIAQQRATSECPARIRSRIYFSGDRC